MNWGEAVRFSANLSMLSAVLMVGACALPDTDSFRLPTSTSLFRPMSVTSYREKVLPPVTAADLVDANGNCAGASVAAANDPAGQNQEAGTALVAGAIALEMSECDVVKRVGMAGRVEIGANQRRERTATLTYSSGERPGIYNFTDGRLTSMELGPEPPAPPKTAKKPAKPPAKRAAQPQPNRVSVQ
jgi:hypothetical protein